ncbi:MAG TPA: ATP-dependent DNA helicase [Steroidobacteraceae bacterium]|nr:ATP-dependent DNA helicase [Steroidobacteraceae bacterium]
MLALGEVFGSDGALRDALADFTPRREQLRMAECVARALEARGLLVVEAGTGTGKTFAYLVPALLSGARVLISTGTRTLQDQLYSKDLPLIARALGRPARVALLKGRANYLCLHRLGLTRTRFAPELLRARDAGLARLERWARTTRSGDLAEVSGLSDSDPLWLDVTSTRDNCLGVRCEDFARCHVAAARRQAQEADIVIVNHHLLLADLALKEDGFGDILGTADAFILDEAHQLPELATRLFGADVGSRRIEHLLEAVRLESVSADATVQSALGGAEQAARELAERVPKMIGRSAWEEWAPRLEPAVLELSRALTVLRDGLDAAAHESAASQLAARASELSGQIERITALGEIEGVRSIEVTPRGFSLHLLPFDIAERFRGMIEARSCAWIFTSATLSMGEDFTPFTGRLGLDDAETVKIESPFDYERQSLLYLPAGLPEPAAPGYVRAMLNVALLLIEASRGGAFVLFTSHRALAEGAQILRELWGANAPYRLYVQGEAPRERLLEAFRCDGDGVLLGTASFWEGVDVKGAALRLVIIDKLPFASPEEPLVKARIDYIESRGGNAFRDFQLPEAALALKQGVGRLIRSETDYGAVVICDRRIVDRAYGAALRAALPPMRCTRDEAEALRFLHHHAGTGGARASAAESERA